MERMSPLDASLFFMESERTRMTGSILHMIDRLHDNRFAFLLRQHHAVMDGATAMQRLLPQSTSARDRKSLPFFAIANPPRQRETRFTRFARLPQRIAGGYKSAGEFVKAIGLVPLIMDKLKGVRFKDKLIFNLAISNVPGPREPHHFNGSEMVAMYPISVLFAGPAPNMTLLGYHEGLQLGIVSADAVPHMQRIAVHARDAFHEIEQAFAAKPAARRSART